MIETVALPPVVLAIAGSEATGGAGAQADLKTFQALGVFGVTALTCIVSFDPNADWCHRFVPVEAQVIADQLEAIHATYTPAAVKTGMLGTVPTIETVAAAVREHRPAQLVVDPVLICKGQEPGAALDIDSALKAQVLPLADFVTPNQYEAALLAGMDIDDLDSVEKLTEAAKRIHDATGAIVLAKGGVRLSGPDAVDVFYDGSTLEELRTPKVGEHAVSGAGCSLAAAITAELAKGADPLTAAQSAKAFVTRGIEARMPGNAPFSALRQLG